MTYAELIAAIQRHIERCNKGTWTATPGPYGTIEAIEGEIRDFEEAHEAEKAEIVSALDRLATQGIAIRLKKQYDIRIDWPEAERRR